MLCDTCNCNSKCEYKSKVNLSTFLECSSKGCKRFSAFFSVVDVLGVDASIEKHYQESKLFILNDGKIGHLDMKEAKGKSPVAFRVGDNIYEPQRLTSWYKLLWLKYLDNNKDLVAFAKGFNDYSDMFKGKATLNCQADVIRQYIKEGRTSIIKECYDFIKMFPPSQTQTKDQTKEEFRIVVAGGRNFNDYELLKTSLDAILVNKKNTHKIIIVSGHAPGADSLGEKYADEREYDKEIYPANWNDLTAVPCKIGTRKDGTQYNILAGLNRNETMGSISNACCLFWDGVSTGTKDMLGVAKKYKLPTRVIKY